MVGPAPAAVLELPEPALVGVPVVNADEGGCWAGCCAKRRENMKCCCCAAVVSIAPALAGLAAEAWSSPQSAVEAFLFTLLRRREGRLQKRVHRDKVIAVSRSVTRCQHAQVRLTLQQCTLPTQSRALLHHRWTLPEHANNLGQLCCGVHSLSVCGLLWIAGHKAVCTQRLHIHLAGKQGQVARQKRQGAAHAPLR